jgi:phosphatidylglycerophosphatase A
MKFFSKAVSTFFGAGYFPLAPGTFASLVAMLLYKLFLAEWSWPCYLLLCLLLVLIGVLASTIYSKQLGQKDPHQIVVDEVCGQWLALFLVPSGWLPVLISFLLFRFFDVVKPYPIRRLEHLSAGWGIMADDLLAGVYAGILVHGYLILK